MPQKAPEPDFIPDEEFVPDESFIPDVEPSQEESVISRLAKGLGRGTTDIISGFGELIKAPFDPSKFILEATLPFYTRKEPMTAAEKVMLGTELVSGIPISSVKERYEKGDVAGAIGEALPAAALFGLPFLRKGRIPTPKEIAPSITPEIPPAIPSVPEVSPTVIRGLLPERATPPEPTPRFISGQEGIADVTQTYPAELAQQVSLESINPKLGTPTLADIGEIIKLPPEIAAEYGRAIGKPVSPPPMSEFDEALAALIPERYKETTKLGTMIEPQFPGVAYPEISKPVYSGEGAARPGQLQLPSAPIRVTRRKVMPEEISKGVVRNPDNSISPVGNPGIKIDNSGNVISTPIDKLLSALEEAKPLERKQAKIYSKERGERFARAEEVTTKGLEGHFERLGMLKGEHTKVVTEPLKLEKVDIDALADTINDAPMLMRGEKTSATEGLVKILEGRVPQLSEVKLLEKVFGKEAIELVKAKLPQIDLKRSLVTDILNLPRTLMASFDLSFPFRQGLPLIHTKAWWTSWNDMIKSYGSEKSYRAVMDSILEKPLFERVLNEKGKLEPSFSERAGLRLTDLAELSSREEAFMSTIAERIPGIGRGVRASSRAFTAFGNKLRADNFEVMIKQAKTIHQNAKKLARTPDELAKAELLNPETNIQLAREIASFINNASGRGSLGMMERHATALNTALFSPRLIASRIQMMNPVNYIFKSKQVRQAYLKSLMATVGAWSTVAGLMKAGGAEVSLDSNSADFMKPKIGNVRLDPGAGFQQYVVLLSRLSSGKFTSSTTGKESELGGGYGVSTRKDVLERFIAPKLNPVLGFGYGMLEASKYQPFNVPDEAASLFVPMVIQDAIEIAKEDPDLLPFLLPAATVGMGTQVYSKEPESLLFGEGGLIE